VQVFLTKAVILVHFGSFDVHNLVEATFPIIGSLLFILTVAEFCLIRCRVCLDNKYY